MMEGTGEQEQGNQPAYNGVHSKRGPNQAKKRRNIIIGGSAVLVVFAVIMVIILLVVFVHKPGTTPHITTDAGVGTTAIKIGAFNIQAFGKTKYGRLNIRDYLIQIVSQYDVILIQEIRDASQVMIYNFLADCQLHRNFSMALSERLGRSTYTEQYAVFYDQNLVTIFDNHTVYGDPNDVFSREPMIAHLTETLGGHSLTLIGVHIAMDDVLEELEAMVDVYNWATSQGYPTDALMMGDFNADCTFFKESDYDALSLYSDTKFTWMINNTADTTVSATDCAYDRFVSVGSANFTNTTIDRFDITFNLTMMEAKKVSDHYPIQTVWIV